MTDGENTMTAVDENTSQVRDFPIRREPTCPFDPPPVYATLREQEPVSRIRLYNGDIAWLVTRHEDVRAMLVDPRFSADRRHPGWPTLAPAEEGAIRLNRSFVGQDPPEHSVQRRMLIPDMTVKYMREKRDVVQGIVDAAIDRMLDMEPPVDLVRNLSYRVSSATLCNLFGIPRDDYEFFHSCTHLVLGRFSTAEQAREGAIGLYTAIDDTIGLKLKEPADDLLGRLVEEQLKPRKISRQEMAIMCTTVFNAGHESTADMISLGILTLMQEPEQRAQLLADPRLIPDAVEELLRYHSIVDAGFRRVATEDMEFRGAHIKAGDGVIGVASAANRDQCAFADPDVVDVHRNARAHVSFGYGVHQCIGQNIARLELELVYRSVFERIPTIRPAVDDVKQLPFKHDSNMYGLWEFPVTW
jgi:cytochrome P450